MAVKTDNIKMKCNLKYCVSCYLYLVCLSFCFLIRPFNNSGTPVSWISFIILFTCCQLKFDSHSHWGNCFSSVSLQQLRANIREMEKLCARVRAEDAAALEMLVKPVRDRASKAARDFLLLHSDPVPQPPPPDAQPSSCVSRSCIPDEDVDEELVSGRQFQLQLPAIPADQSAVESWDNLEEVCMSRPCCFH